MCMFVSQKTKKILDKNGKFVKVNVLATKKLKRNCLYIYIYITNNRLVHCKKKKFTIIINIIIIIIAMHEN